MKFLAVFLVALLTFSFPVAAAPSRHRQGGSGSRGGSNRGGGRKGGGGAPAAGGAGGAVVAAPPATGDGQGGDNNEGGAPVAAPATGGQGGLAIDPALIPDFGVVRGVDRDAVQIGSCSGSNGSKVVLIQCSCPPDRDVFLQRLSEAVAAGESEGVPVSFNNDASDTSPEAQRERATAGIIVLQNFNGKKASGCPAVSAPNFLIQQQTGVRSDKVFIS